jgi:hypothetical protein
MTRTERNPGPVASPATLGADPDPIAWGQDTRPDCIAAAIMSTWAPNAPGTHYAPGFSAREVTRLAVLRFSIGDAGGYDV